MESARDVKDEPASGLDSVYGRGNADQPYLYQQGDLHHFLVGPEQHPPSVSAPRPDLPRNAEGVALTGDPRNDENLIVSQLQSLFLRFHNRFFKEHATLPFEEIQRQVRFHYQWVVTHDFLRRIISARVLEPILPHLFEGSHDKANVVNRPPKLRFYHPADGAFMPLEFSAAAYRFGHSMVRPGYRLNDKVAPIPAIRRHTIEPESPRKGHSAQGQPVSR